MHKIHVTTTHLSLSALKLDRSLGRYMCVGHRPSSLGINQLPQNWQMLIRENIGMIPVFPRFFLNFKNNYVYKIISIQISRVGHFVYLSPLHLTINLKKMCKTVTQK